MDGLHISGFWITSGGQTGVDRAALDVARETGVTGTGWCPSGRLAEDGPLPDYYPLTETPKRDYSQRTRWNVRDTDGTLVLTIGTPDGGTAYTIRVAEELGKPHLVLDLSQKPSPDAVLVWLQNHAIRKLNVAGPRESKQPGIYERTIAFLISVVERITI